MRNINFLFVVSSALSFTMSTNHIFKTYSILRPNKTSIHLRREPTFPSPFNPKPPIPSYKILSKRNRNGPQYFSATRYLYHKTIISAKIKRINLKFPGFYLLDRQKVLSERTGFSGNLPSVVFHWMQCARISVKLVLLDRSRILRLMGNPLSPRQALLIRSSQVLPGCCFFFLSKVNAKVPNLAMLCLQTQGRA